MATTQTIPDGAGGQVLLASPLAGILARVSMDPAGVDFSYTTEGGTAIGPITFTGQKGTWTLRGPSTAPAKSLGAVPDGYQRYVLVDGAGKVAHDFLFSDKWLKVRAVSAGGKVLL